MYNVHVIYQFIVCKIYRVPLHAEEDNGCITMPMH